MKENKKYFKITSGKYTKEMLKKYEDYIKSIENKTIDIDHPEWMPYDNLETNIGYIYLEKGIPIGNYYIASFKNGEKYLYGVFISKRYRGKGKCYEMIKEGIDDFGKGILLSVKRDNIAAIKCYKKLGFEELPGQNIHKQYMKMYLYKLTAYYKEKNELILNEFEKRRIKIVSKWDDADIIWKPTLKGVDIKPNQYVNNFDGIYEFSYKDNLIRTYSDKNLNCNGMMIDYIDQTYFPISAVINVKNNLDELYKCVNKIKTKNKAFQMNIWILKPAQLFGGQDIYIIYKDIPNIKDGTYILQRYIDAPLLYDSRKYDIRQFILVMSNDLGIPEIYKYNKFHCRISTKKYSNKDLSDKRIHITNTKIQSEYENSNYVESMDIVNMKARGKIDEMIKKLSKKIKEKINPNKDKNRFSLIGLDIMLDKYENVYLLEMNLNPDLEKINPKQPFDEIIRDTFILAIDKDIEKNVNFMKIC